MFATDEVPVASHYSRHFLSMGWGKQGDFQLIASGLLWADIKNEQNNLFYVTYTESVSLSPFFFFQIYLSRNVQSPTVLFYVVLLVFSDRQEEARNFVFHSYWSWMGMQGLLSSLTLLSANNWSSISAMKEYGVKACLWSTFSHQLYKVQKQEPQDLSHLGVWDGETKILAC